MHWILIKVLERSTVKIIVKTSMLEAYESLTANTV